ncbi:MAG: N-acetylmuramoyl-L-alanine amidase [bacterium]
MNFSLHLGRAPDQLNESGNFNMRVCNTGCLQKIVIFTCLFVASSNYAQNLEFSDSLRLRVVIPSEGDTVAFDQVRYAGSALSTARVWVQGQETRVYPSGAFVGLVSLEPGTNEIVVTARDSLGVLSDTVAVFRPTPVQSLPRRPTRIDPEQVKPTSDVSIVAGEFLEVEFQGSPGGKASFTLDKIAKNLSMAEVPPSQAHGLRGVYRGVVRIPSLKEFKPRPIKFKLRGRDGHTARTRSEGKVRVLPAARPLIGVTADSNNIVTTEPDGVILTELPAGIKLEILKESGAITRVRLANNVVGYLASSSLGRRALSGSLPFADVGSISVFETRNWLQVRINVSNRVAYRLEQLLRPAALEIYFYRAQHSSEWISNLPDNKHIKIIRRRQQGSDVAVVRIELIQKQQWGFRGAYLGNQFWLNIRKTPRFSAAADSLLLQGLVIAVDPGHGGENHGALGATGLEEKTVNLRYTMKVADLLEAAGATVVRTRNQDTTMTLQERIDLAQRAQAHIFVWLHNNSVGLSTDPLRVRGTSTYYTVPQAMAIAKSVYARLLKLGLQPYGRITSTYFVTRQTSMLSFLVEATFLSHPEDEMLLMNDAFLEDLAVAVVAGIKDFVREQIAEEIESSFPDTEKTPTSAPGSQ